MSKPHQKLAQALTELRKLQRGGKRVFKSDQLRRSTREILLRNGFLEQIIPGWLLSTQPGTAPGDTTPWFSAFWEFCSRYCHERFNRSWHLSPELSIQLQVEDFTVPNNIVVHAPKGANNRLGLPHEVSLFDLKKIQGILARDIVAINRLRLIRLPLALIKVNKSFFSDHPHESAAALASLRSSSDLLAPLLKGGHSTVAGRLVGALRHLGHEDMANDILQAMKAAGHTIVESNPFDQKQHIPPSASGTSPIVTRLSSLWDTMRPDIAKRVPATRPLLSTADYLKHVEEAYTADAYHSLSIEGYNVSERLIERVSSGHWAPDADDEDRKSRDALAARGYWQAFQAVKSSVKDILEGAAPGETIRSNHRAWYRALFRPCVAAGIIAPQELAGYRNGPVYIQGSRHTPPRHEVVPQAMDTFFTLLEEEENAVVRAVLGHWMFSYIHPYPDGNGRMARFIMNTMLASGGHPWRIITVNTRNTYMQTLEAASIDSDIRPFAEFISKQ